MKLRTIVREAFLNITTGSTRLAVFASVLAAVITVLAGAEVETIASIDERAREFRDSGGSTVIYRMEAGIDGAACDRLRELPGVSATGAVRRREAGESAAALPDQQIPTFDISPGFGGFRALGNPHASDGVLISEDAAGTLGVGWGRRLPLTEARPPISGTFTYPADGRQPGYGYAILSPTDTRAAFDECWVECWPLSDDVLAILPTALLPGAAAEKGPGAQGPRLQQLNASRGTHFDGAMQFANRISRFAPAIALLAGATLGFIATSGRKLELAAALHAGVTRGAQALHVVIEAGAWALASLTLALPPLAMLITETDGSPAAPLIVVAARVAVAAASGTLIGASAAVFTVKERHLFTYFKTR